MKQYAARSGSGESARSLFRPIPEQDFIGVNRGKNRAIGRERQAERFTLAFARAERLILGAGEIDDPQATLARRRDEGSTIAMGGKAIASRQRVLAIPEEEVVANRV